MHFATLLVIKIYEISVRANLSGGKFVIVRLESFFCNSAPAVMAIAMMQSQRTNCGNLFRVSIFSCSERTHFSTLILNQNKSFTFKNHYFV